MAIIRNILCFTLLSISINAYTKDCLDYFGWHNTLDSQATSTELAVDYIQKFAKATPLKKSISFVGPGICKMTHVRSTNESINDMIERIFDLGYGRNIILGKQKNLIILHETFFPNGDKYCSSFFEDQENWMVSFLSKAKENGYTGNYLGKGIYNISLPRDRSTSLISYTDNKTPTTFKARYHEKTKSIFITQILKNRGMLCVFPNVDIK